MFQCKKYIRLLITLCTLFILMGCKETDLPEKEIGEQIPEGMEKITFLIPDYAGGSAQFGTRAFNEEQEGYMSNLYLIAVKYVDYQYDVNGDLTKTKLATPKVYSFSLNPIGEKFQLKKDDFHLFNVALYPGEYRMGMIANADLYLQRATKITDFTEESQLNDIVLNYDENTMLAPTHLPMVCMPENMKYSEGLNGEKVSVADIEDNLIPINRINKEEENQKDTEIHIWVTMSFLCSKVRYTILFDKTVDGISNSFGTSWIRFNVDDQKKPTVTNLRRQTQLIPGVSQGGDQTPYDENDPFIHHYNEDEPHGFWTMDIGRYYWSGREWSEDPDWKTNGTLHGTEDADYPLTPTSKLDPWDRSTAEWIPMEQKVWQGVVYLPENDGSTATDPTTGEALNTSIERTLLRFPYHTRANSLEETPEEEANEPKYIYLFGNTGEEYYEGNANDSQYTQGSSSETWGLKRNIMYDVVAQVINPDEEGLKIKVFVNVIPWHSTDQNINESVITNN